MHDLLAVTSDEGDGQRKPLIELVINVTSLTRPIAPVTCNLGVSSRESAHNLVGGHARTNLEKHLVERRGNQWLVGCLRVQRRPAAEQKSENDGFHGVGERRL